MANYIMQIDRLDGEDVGIMLYNSENEILESLWCVVAVDGNGATIIDNGYRSHAEVKESWPDAIG